MSVIQGGELAYLHRLNVRARHEKRPFFNVSGQALSSVVLQWESSTKVERRLIICGVCMSSSMA